MNVQKILTTFLTVLTFVCLTGLLISFYILYRLYQTGSDADLIWRMVLTPVYVGAMALFSYGVVRITVKLNELRNEEGSSPHRMYHGH